MKTCTKCKVDRPVVEFSRDKGRPDGRYSHCKFCRHDYYRQNFRRIQDQYQEYRRRPENVEKLRLWHQDYSSRRFFYRTANNLKIRANDKTAVATMADISRLWKKQRGICPITGRRLNQETAQLDHIIPLKRGGSDVIENLRWVHRDVNYAKRDLLDDDFFRLCSDVIAYRSSQGHIHGKYVADDPVNAGSVEQSADAERCEFGERLQADSPR